MKKKIEELRNFGHSGLKVTIDLNDEIAIAMLLSEVRAMIQEEEERLEREGFTSNLWKDCFPYSGLKKVESLLSKLTTVSLPDANHGILEDDPCSDPEIQRKLEAVKVINPDE